MKSYKLFLDTWGIICIYNKSELYHKEVASYFNICIKENYSFFTTNFVFSETISFLYRKLNHEKAKSITEHLFDSLESDFISLVEIDYERMQNGLKLRYQLKDKHFEQVNMGFELKPDLKR